MRSVRPHLVGRLTPEEPLRTTPESKIKNWWEGSTTPPSSDPLVERMKRQQIPVTRENYLQLAGLTEPLTAEEEWMLPPELSRVGKP
jgi:hypothetical protein